MKEIKEKLYPEFLTFWRKSLQGDSDFSGGYSGFQVTGMVERFFGGLKFSIFGFFGVGKILASIFGYSKQTEDSW